MHNFNSIMNYRIIFWRNSSYSNTVFKLHTKIIRIMMNPRITDSCTEYFMKLNFLPLQSQHLLMLVLSVINNKNQFAANSEVHSINNRNKTHCHQPPSILTTFRKGPYYFVIKVFSCLLENVKNVSHINKQFKSAKVVFLS